MTDSRVRYIGKRSFSINLELTGSFGESGGRGLGASRDDMCSGVLVREK